MLPENSCFKPPASLRTPFAALVTQIMERNVLEKRLLEPGPAPIDAKVRVCPVVSLQKDKRMPWVR